MSDLINEMNEVLSQQEIAQRHSYFQLKYFLIGKEPTYQSKMWQCLRELRNRVESLDNMSLEIDELKDKIEILDISKNRISYSMEKTDNSDSYLSDLQRKESMINMRQLERQKTSLNNNIKEIEERKKSILEECRFFIETYKNLVKIEPLKHFDDLHSQMQYWHEKLTQKVNLKMLTGGNIETELIETIIALPDEVQIKQQTLQTLNKKQELLLKAHLEDLRNKEN